jgi:hypothetical protein
MRRLFHLPCFSVAAVLLLSALPASAQAPAKPPTEDDYYRMITFPLPKEVVLEVGGMDWLDKAKKRLAVCTRRGELWVLDNVYASEPALEGEKIKVKDAAGRMVDADPDPANIVRFKRMLFGMHEPLGMIVNPGLGYPDGIYMAQRTELTRAVDENGDDQIDLVETFAEGWEVSGGYHEYAFGPKLGKDGKMWITLNRPFGGGQEPTAYWRGWAVTVDNKGKMEPVCPGLRSPAGLGANAEGDVFFTDNQGDHVASGKLGHLKAGVFHGNPVGLESCDHPLSNFQVPFKDYPKLNMRWGEAVAANPRLIAPAIWFPYPAMGRSQTDVLWDSTEGKFGPFSKQLFVGDLSNAIVMRVFLEKVDGEYQGACFPFRRGFRPPVLRMEWGGDGSMFVGGSSRGWGGGAQPYGLARLAWTGEVPFEVHEMRATSTGFELTFTRPLDAESAGDPASYAIECYTHNFYSRYGDDQQDKHPVKITSAVVGKDGKSVRLELEQLQPYYVHYLKLGGVRSQDGLPVLHPEAYYTLNRIPAG